MARSGLFDAEFYAADNLDLGRRSARALLSHYLARGWREGRRPSIEFDLESYFRDYRDLLDAGQEPIRHYLLFGQHENRRLRPRAPRLGERGSVLERLAESALFDRDFYLDQVPQLRGRRIDPLFHYLVSGYRDFLEPSPHLSMRAFEADRPELRRAEMNPLLAYLDQGRPEGYSVRDANSAAWRFDVESICWPSTAVEPDRRAGRAFLTRFRGRNGIDRGLPAARAALGALLPRKGEGQPQVSVIVTLDGPEHLLLSCLDSLGRESTTCPLDIMIVGPMLGQAAEATIAQLGIRRLGGQGSFVKLAALGLTAAQCDVTVILSSRMRLARGSLDAVISCFKADPDAGCIIPQRLENDWLEGRLAGLHPGHDPHDPDAPEQRRARVVQSNALADLPQRASLAVRRSALSGVAGGLSALIESGGRVAGGMMVWYQPFFTVTAIGPHAPRHLDRVRFGPALARPLLPPTDYAVPESAARHRRLLVIDSFTPKPDQDSGSVITAQMMTAYQQLGYEVTFLPIDGYRFEGTYSETLQRSGITALYAPFVSSVAEVLERCRPFDLVLAYRYGVMERVAPAVRAHLPNARLIFHNVDLHYLREMREAELRGDEAGLRAAANTRRRELAMVASADCTIVHTGAEKALIEAELPAAPILEFPYIAEVHPSAAPLDVRHDVMFLGGFAHQPNVDAVHYLVESIWPALEDRLPASARLLIVGAAPPSDVRGLAGPRIIVTGQVPDLTPWFDRARVFLAPLRYGAGIKGKLIQSMAHGVPAVASTIAAEGIGISDGSEAFVADDPASVVERTIRLYNDETHWRTMQEAGLNFVRTRYSWQRCLDLCRRAVDIADATWRARDPAQDFIGGSGRAIRATTIGCRP